MKGSQSKGENSTFALSVAAVRVLLIGLPVILVELVAMLIFLLRDRAVNPTYALHRYPILLEHIMMSLTLIIIGAFLFDYVSRKKE